VGRSREPPLPNHKKGERERGKKKDGESKGGDHVVVLLTGCRRRWGELTDFSEGEHLDWEGQDGGQPFGPSLLGMVLGKFLERHEVEQNEGSATQKSLTPYLWPKKKKKLHIKKP